MHFWKIDKLKEDITTGRFSEKDRFLYVIAYSILGSIGLGFLTYMPVENPNLWDLIVSIGNMVIPVVGIYFAYKANNGADGSDFLGRFFSINFVILIRFVVLLIPLIIVLAAYYAYTFQEEINVVSTPVDTIPFLIWLALLYVRTCKHIGDVNGSKQ